MMIKLMYCFKYDMKICPKCVPAQSSQSCGHVPICGVFRSSYGNERHIERMTAQLEQNYTENNKSVTEESFLDITVKYKGALTPKKALENIVEKPKDEKLKGVCSHYLKSRCKHGRIGKDCLWQHPNICFRRM